MPRRAWYGVAAAVAGVVAVGLLALWRPQPQGPSLVDVSPSEAPLRGTEAAVLSAQLLGQPLASESWVTASAGPAELVFSDGSQILLAEGARARITELSREGLRLSLESGHLEADITPNQGYHWVIAAGPHRVSVLGTAFSVDWSPEAHRLHVAVTRGKVQVSGGEHSKELDAPQLLVAGDTLTREPPSTSGAIAALPAEALPRELGPEALPRELPPQALPRERPPEALPRGAAPSKRVPGPPAPTPEVPAVERTVEPAPSAPTSAPAHERWRELAKAGSYREALAAARELGVDGLVVAASASDLLLLADSARLGGAPQLAERALLSLRKRFRSHPNASVAAFSLGRLAAETRGDQRAAIKWFNTYLRSAPSGGLADGARGRLLTAYLEVGDRAAARRAARDYLKHHPSGSHASVARSLLDD